MFNLVQLFCFLFCVVASIFADTGGRSIGDLRLIEGVPIYNQGSSFDVAYRSLLAGDKMSLPKFLSLSDNINGRNINPYVQLSYSLLKTISTQPLLQSAACSKIRDRAELHVSSLVQGFWDRFFYNSQVVEKFSADLHTACCIFLNSTFWQKYIDVSFADSADGFAVNILTKIPTSAIKLCTRSGKGNECDEIVIDKTLQHYLSRDTLMYGLVNIEKSTLYLLALSEVILRTIPSRINSLVSREFQKTPNLKHMCKKQLVVHSSFTGMNDSLYSQNELVAALRRGGVYARMEYMDTGALNSVKLPGCFYHINSTLRRYANPFHEDDFVYLLGDCFKAYVDLLRQRASTVSSESLQVLPFRILVEKQRLHDFAFDLLFKAGTDYALLYTRNALGPDFIDSLRASFVRNVPLMNSTDQFLLLFEYLEALTLSHKFLSLYIVAASLNQHVNLFHELGILDKLYNWLSNVYQTVCPVSLPLNVQYLKLVGENSIVKTVETSFRFDPNDFDLLLDPLSEIERIASLNSEWTDRIFTLKTKIFKCYSHEKRGKLFRIAARL